MKQNCKSAHNQAAQTDSRSFVALLFVSGDLRRYSPIKDEQTN